MDRRVRPASTELFLAVSLRKANPIVKKFLTARLVAAGSTAVLVGGLAAVAGSANAAGPDSFSCTFSGSTGNSLTPIPQPPAHGTPASTNLSEEGDAAYTTGSTGTYTF